MSKKHFKKLAEAIRLEFERAGCVQSTEATQRIAHAIAEICADDNPNFDRSRFLAACGIES